MREKKGASTCLCLSVCLCVCVSVCVSGCQRVSACVCASVRVRVGHYRCLCGSSARYFRLPVISIFGADVPTLTRCLAGRRSLICYLHFVFGRGEAGILGRKLSALMLANERNLYSMLPIASLLQINMDLHRASVKFQYLNLVCN